MTVSTEKKRLLLPMKAESLNDSNNERDEWTRSIRSLNDAFRLSFTSTELHVSPGVLELSIGTQTEILDRVRNYRNFTEDNDPSMLHNKGQFDCQGHNIVWEIYCMNNDGRGESPDPANLDLTRRHMMVLLEDESWEDLPLNKSSV